VKFVVLALMVSDQAVLFNQFVSKGESAEKHANPLFRE